MFIKWKSIQAYPWEAITVTTAESPRLCRLFCYPETNMLAPANLVDKLS